MNKTEKLQKIDFYLSESQKLLNELKKDFNEDKIYTGGELFQLLNQNWGKFKEIKFKELK
jgi:hypothetical protein